MLLTCIGTAGLTAQVAISSPVEGMKIQAKRMRRNLQQKGSSEGLALACSQSQGGWHSCEAAVPVVALMLARQWGCPTAGRCTGLSPFAYCNFCRRSQAAGRMAQSLFGVEGRRPQPAPAWHKERYGSGYGGAG